MAQRLVYAPSVQAYIQSGTDRSSITNITNDIISGSITRRTDAPSSASLTLQNRDGKYNGTFLPMDRIIIYLKKVKPILVFSGYLDTVPFLQPVPGPATITASCTLKLLEFTYFDPALPRVQAMMAKFVGAGDKFAATPQAGGQPFMFFDMENANGIVNNDKNVSEVGFGRMLHFLVSVVGNWDAKKVHILDIPDGWIETSVALFEQIQKNEAETASNVKEIVKKLLTSSVKTVTTATGADSSNTTSASYDGSGGVIIQASDEELATTINNRIQANPRKGGQASPMRGMGNIFVEEGRKTKIDPRFLAAIADFESWFGCSTYASDGSHNPYGLGGSNKRRYSSWEEGIRAGFQNLINGPYFKENRYSIADIGAKWAPPGADDARGENSGWPAAVGAIYSDLGGNPSAPNVRWDVDAADGGEQDRTGGTQGSGSTKVTMTFDASLLTRGISRTTNASFAQRFVGAGHIAAMLLYKYKKLEFVPIRDGTVMRVVPKSDNEAGVQQLEEAASLAFEALNAWSNNTQIVAGDRGSNRRWGFNVVKGLERTAKFYGAGLEYILSMKHSKGGKKEFHLKQVSSGDTSLRPNREGKFTVEIVLTNDQPNSNPYGSAVAPRRVGGSPSDRPSGENSSGGQAKYNVYIEAGHTDPMQPGYTNQTGAGNAGLGDERTRNKALKAKVEAALSGHPKINVMSTSGSKPPSSGIDIYISLHHDQRNGGAARSLDYPSDRSKNQAGAGLPNIYPDGGGTPIDPPRKNIHQNEQLKKDSKALGDAIIAETGFSHYTNSVGMKNYYGYYHSNAKACVLIEAEAVNNAYNYETVGTQIADGIKAFINAGGPSGGGSGSGDDTPASQLIRACMRTAMKNNGGKGHGVLGYQLGGRRNVPLIQAENENASMDCSGFIGNGMIEIGVKDKSYSPFTGSFITESGGVGSAIPRDQIKAGHLLISGGETTSGGSVHMGLYCGNGKMVHCSGGGKGPNINDLSSWDSDYKVYEHPSIGTTDNPPTGAEEGASTGAGGAEVKTLSPFGALNAVFNFPGDPLTSLVLQGSRALENDVKLLTVISQVAESSLRTFASHPNGDFMAWFPDYFNVSGKSPYLVISDNELVDCTISLSDTNLATHVFVTADLTGSTFTPGADANDLLLKLITGQWGVVNIEQSYLLDSFLVSSKERGQLVQDIASAGGVEKKKQKKVRKPLLDREASGIDKFLSRYGARPFAVSEPVISHPYLTFFRAYQWFQRKWAEQFQSEVQFTFMPELFPGTIVGIESMGVNFYCEEVTHSFDYASGFNTSASLMAPSASGKTNVQNLGISIARPNPIKAPPKENQETQEKILNYKEWLKRNRLKSSEENAKKWRAYQAVQNNIKDNGS
jgi:cell wall-associated NlpC family hydrolase